MANGIVIVDKPAGWTSQDVAAKLRGVFHERHVGHGGTLDPMATGVLPVFVGRATRAAEFCESAEKEYVAGLRLGLTTDTQDTTGRTLSERPVTVSREDVLAALPRFTGEILQLPPMYSAIKINGKKLYELARRGKEAERPARPVTVFELELLSGAGADYVLRVRCSKGTYIRALCHDLGEALGCGGCMSSLRRTAAGRFSLAQARTMEEILAFAAQDDPQKLLLPVDELFAEFPAVSLTAEQTVRVKNGAIVRSRAFPEGQARVYGDTGEFLALGRTEDGVLTAVKSFFEVN
jgi:tRNA pseudouridine55 synthase